MLNIRLVVKKWPMCYGVPHENIRANLSSLPILDRA